MRKGNHVNELIPAYVIGCLDEDETVQVSQHLTVCEQCRSELIDYQEVVDHIAFAAPFTEPDPAVKDKLMERIRAGQAAKSESEPRPSLWDQITMAFGRRAPAWALVSMVLVVLLGVSNIFLWQKMNSMEESPRLVAMQTINMSGTSVAPQATGLIVVSSDGDHGTLVVEHLPTLGEADQYQLWLIDNGKRTSGGVFSVGEDGYGSLWVVSPQALSQYTAFGVTIEPAGGSSGPTGEKVLGSET